MLDADGDAQQARADAGAHPLLGAQGGVAHRRRMGDEAFDAAERFRERDAGQAVDESADGRLAAAKLERKHRAEPILLALGNIVPRMRGKAGVMNALDRRVAGQQLGNGGAILLVDAEPGSPIMRI